MRIANHAGRLTVLTEDCGIDLDLATGGRFGLDILDALERWTS
jgi:hypothetical protein